MSLIKRKGNQKAILDKIIRFIHLFACLSDANVKSC